MALIDRSRFAAVAFSRHAIPSPKERPAIVAFALTGMMLFGLRGTVMGTWLAPAVYPAAKQFEEHGGTIQTAELDSYRSMPMYWCFGGMVLGLVAGGGFYTAWRDRKSVT
jgi:hypothetical protein